MRCISCNDRSACSSLSLFIICIPVTAILSVLCIILLISVSQLIQQQGQILTLLTGMMNQNAEQRLQAPILPTQSSFGQLLLPPHSLRPTLPSVKPAMSTLGAMSQSKVTTPQLNSSPHLMQGQTAVNTPQNTLTLLGQQVVHPEQHTMLHSLGQLVVSPSPQATLPFLGNK